MYKKPYRFVIPLQFKAKVPIKQATRYAKRYAVKYIIRGGIYYDRIWVDPRPLPLATSQKYFGEVKYPTHRREAGLEYRHDQVKPTSYRLFKPLEDEPESGRWDGSNVFVAGNKATKRLAAAKAELNKKPRSVFRNRSRSTKQLVAA